MTTPTTPDPAEPVDPAPPQPLDLRQFYALFRAAAGSDTVTLRADPVTAQWLRTLMQMARRAPIGDPDVAAWHGLSTVQLSTAPMVPRGYVEVGIGKLIIKRIECFR